MKILVTKSNFLYESDLRLDAAFHLSDGSLTLQLFKKAKIPTQPLKNVTSKIFYGGRSKRIYVKNESHGLPFIKGADISKIDFSLLKYISRSRTINLNEYFLEKGWTLITRSGTIGNTAYVNDDFINKAASDDIIRVVPANIPSGFLFAFLSSKYGRGLIQHGTYGAVIQHIEPEHIENIPVPVFPKDKQNKIHNLIEGSANLRTKANAFLRQALQIFENSLPDIKSEKIFISNLKDLLSNNKRLDATTNYVNISHFYKNLALEYELKPLSKLAGSIFTPNIFKRIRVVDAAKGIPFLSGSDLLDFSPSLNSFLSKKMKNIDNYILEKGWIAIQDAGTIGYVSLISGALHRVSATNNLVRIVPNKKSNANPYVFAFLRTKQGQMILKSYEYGSVQKHIDHYQVSSMLIPLIPDFKLITDLVNSHLENITEASIKEKKAIQLVETEIEQWQKL